MKKIILIAALLFTFNLSAADFEKANNSSKTDNKSVDKEIREWSSEDESGKKVFVLFRYIVDGVVISLSIEREDGETIRQNSSDGAFLLPPNAELIPIISLENQGDVRPVYNIPVKFPVSFKNYMKIDRCVLIRNGEETVYDMDGLFDSTGRFNSKIKITNLPKGNTKIVMRQAKK
jgi:hypothetical protein